MRYAELHCRTNFSFLEGASHPDELVARAAELGYEALAITDRHSLAGVVRAHGAARQAGLRLIVGAQIAPVDAPPVVLWVTDRAAYGRLSRLITVGRRRAGKGACQLTLDDVAAHADGLLAGVVPAEGWAPSMARSDPHLPGSLRAGAAGPWRDALRAYRDIFGGRGYLLAELHCGPDDARRLEELSHWSRASALPLVAAGDVHYHDPERMALHDLLAAIRLGTTVAEMATRSGAGEGRFPNAERHLHAREEIAARFARAPEAIRRTVEIAARCTFTLDELRYEYPEELAPPGWTPPQYLATLTWKGARKRYPGGVPARVRGLLEHELALIEELRYEAYFLTVWDLVHFARRRGILCQGRGSAANSAVCYCLGITAVDPARTDVLFERFISRERDEAPDIDVDFEHERREEVLQYVYDKYGRERAGLAAEVITYRCRSAVRDAGKALGLSLDRVDALARQVEGGRHDPQLAQRCRQVGLDPDSDTGQRLIHLVHQLIGFPRHLSQHVGGMVITRGPLCELVPIENAAMPDRTVIQWDKHDLDQLGILKVDCLALGMLTAIRKCFDLVRACEEDERASAVWPRDAAGSHRPPSLTLAGIPPDDPRVYDMICRADTMGVFQIESRAQMSMLPRLRPRCYYDLVIEVAIVRPGPIQGQMVHPYLRRRMGQEPVTYPNEEIRQVLQKTLGVPIFQEQAMRLAVVAAGFTPGEADQLRRAMGAWRRPGVIDPFRQKLEAGMLARGLSLRFAQQLFQQIRGFGEYGFPESHAASFALLVYVSAWLKHYYPAAFTAALLNSQPMGFYGPAQLIRDARQHGVEVRPVDVNHSCWDCTLEPVAAADRAGQNPAPRQTAARGRQGESVAEPSAADAPRPSARQRVALRLGFRLLVGFSARDATAIERARAAGPFSSLHDLARRTQLGRPVLRRLAESDALASLGCDRRHALWEALAQPAPPHPMPLLDALPPDEDGPPRLPPLGPQAEVFADYRTTGLSLKDHPLSFYRRQLDRLQVLTAVRLATFPAGRLVRVAGLVILRQRPGTAKGITFVTLEDETGIANLVVHAATWQRFYAIARRAPAWIAQGRLERKHGVIHVVVRRLEDLAQQLHQLGARSRDFR